MHSLPLQDLLSERYSQGERDLRDLGDRLHAIELSHLLLEDCNLDGANLANSILSKVTLKNIDLAGASLQGAQFSEVCLSGSNLKHADLSHASLSECDLRFCIFSGAKFEGADIGNCQIGQSVFINATYDSSTVFPHDFVPEDRGMIQVSESPAEQFCDTPEEGNASDDAAELASSSEAEQCAVSPPEDTAGAEVIQKKTYFYRGRQVEI